MELSPCWEADSRSATQEFPCLLWNPNFHDRVHKRPPPLPIQGHMNSVNFSEIYFNIIPPPTSRSSWWPLSVGFPTKTPHIFSFSPARVTCPSYPILLTWSFWSFLWKSTSYEPPCYAIWFLYIHFVLVFELWNIFRAMCMYIPLVISVAECHFSDNSYASSSKWPHPQPLT
jgi:hypothetical protein